KWSYPSNYKAPNYKEIDLKVMEERYQAYVVMPNINLAIPKNINSILISDLFHILSHMCTSVLVEIAPDVRVMLEFNILDVNT
ncbi:hypothetical protein L9F63_011922, partial [Diploptera punctata]